MKREHSRFILGGCIFALLLLSTCQSCNTNQSNRDNVRIGGHTTQLGASLKIAEAKGFYKHHGLNAEIRLVESSRESMAAMEAGQFDVVIGSLAAGSFNMVNKGDLVILADASRVIPSIIVRKDLWDNNVIQSLSDLKGRSIMTPREGSSSYYALARILRGIGLGISDVTPKALEDNATLAALEAKQIDAAILNEPHATTAVEKGLGIRFEIREVQKFFPPNGQQHMVLYARRQTLEEKRELLRRFLAAYIEAVNFYDDAREGKQPQRGEAVNIIAAYTGAESSIVEKVIWPYVSRDGKPDISYIQEMYDYFLQQKLIDKPFNVESSIRLELLPGNQ